MAIAPIPVAAYLVPEHSRATPDGFTLVEEALTRGLPHTITLGGDVRLTLVLPTGLARAWRDSDSTAVVTTSDDERLPRGPHTPAPVGDSGRAPLRLVAQVGQDVVAIVPVVAGRRQITPDAGDPSRKLSRRRAAQSLVDLRDPKPQSRNRPAITSRM